MTIYYNPELDQLALDGPFGGLFFLTYRPDCVNIMTVVSVPEITEDWIKIGKL